MTKNDNIILSNTDKKPLKVKLFYIEKTGELEIKMNKFLEIVHCTIVKIDYFHERMFIYYHENI